MTHTSYPTVMLNELFEQLFFKFSYDDEIYWSFREGVSVEDILKNQPELLKAFLDIFDYHSSPKL